MAKRKSFNRRLSKYNRFSAASAILDADTGNLSDEQNFWWKNLENDTIARPSIEPSVGNQTTRHLSDGSYLETSKIQDGWWKALETSDISTSAKIVMKHVHPDVQPLIESSTSESEQEPRVQRKKNALSVATRRSEGNAFLNVLHDSIKSRMSGSLQGNKKDNTTKNSRLDDKPSTHKVQLHTNRKDSAEESITEKVLKAKPRIFKKRINQSQNIFDDVLNKDTPDSPSKRKSFGTLLDDVEHKRDASSSIIYTVIPSRASLSFETDRELLHHPNPKAQSTVLEDSTWRTHGTQKDISESESESEILKPKSMFLRRNKRDVNENAFENILTTKELDKEDERREQLNLSSNATERMYKLPSATNVVEMKLTDLREAQVERSSLLRKEDVLALKINNRNSVTRNDIDKSGDSFSLTEDDISIIKPSSESLQNSSDATEKNRFRDILKENESIGVQQKTMTVPKEREVVIENQRMLKRSNSILKQDRTTINCESGSGSLSLRLSPRSNEDDNTGSVSRNIIVKQKEEVDKNNDVEIKTAIEDRRSNEAVDMRYSTNVSNGDQSISRKRHKSLRESQQSPITPGIITSHSKKNTSKSQNWMFETSSYDSELEDDSIERRENANSSKTSVMPGIHESNLQGDVNTTKRKSKSLSKSQKQATLPGADDSHLEDQNTVQKENKSLRRSKQSVAFVANDSSLEQDRNTTEDKNKILRRSQKRKGSPISHHTSLKESKQSVASLASDSSLHEDNDSTNRKRKNLSRSQKRASSPVLDHSHLQEQNAAKRHSRNLRGSDEQPATSDMNDSNIQEEGESTLRQSKRLKRSQQQISAPMSDHSDLEDHSTANRQSRNLRGSSKQLAASDMHDSSLQKDRGTTLRQSKNLSRSQNQTSIPGSDHSDLEDHNTAKRQSRNLRGSSKQPAASDMNDSSIQEEGRSTLKQSKRLSRSQQQISAPVSYDSDLEDQSTTKRQTSRKSLRQKSILSLDDSDLEGHNLSGQRPNSFSVTQTRTSSQFSNKSSSQIKSPTKRSSTRLSNLRQSNSPIKSDAETGNLEIKKGKVVNSIRKQSSLNGSHDFVLDTCEAVRETKSKSLSRSGKPSVATIIEEFDVETEENIENNKSVNTSDSIPQSTMKVWTSNSIKTTEQVNTSVLNKTDRKEVRNVKQYSLSYALSNSHNKEDASTSRNERKNTNESQSDIPSISYENEEEEQDMHENHQENIAQSENVSALKESTQQITRNHPERSKGQKNIKEFFQVSTVLPASQVLSNKEKLEDVKQRLEKIKAEELAALKKDTIPTKVKLPWHKKINKIPKSTNATMTQRPKKPVDKAYLVNGKVYKAPRLPRPKYWVTNRLYEYLWKCMEPKHQMETRIRSERFVQQLSDVMSLILKRKKYASYEDELLALMKEMARLDIIHTRWDFYQFCHDFLPYELRIKTTPILLPGNETNIPYDKDALKKPLLNS